MTETDYKALGVAIRALAVAAIGLIVLASLALPVASSAKTLQPDLLDQCRRRGECTWIEGKLIPPGSIIVLNTKGLTISGNTFVGVNPSWVEPPTMIMPGEALVEDTCAEYDPVTGEEMRRWPVVHTWFLGSFIDCDAEHLPSFWWRVKLRWREMLDGRQH